MGLNFFKRSGDIPTASFAVSSTDAQQERQVSLNCELVTKWVIYVSAFLLPLFFLPWTTGILETNKQALLVLLAGIGLMAWLIGVVISGHIRLRSTRLDAIIGGLLFSTLIGAVFSFAVSKSVLGFNTNVSESLISVFALSLVYFLAVYTIRDRGIGIRTALLSGVIVALILALLQAFAVYILPFAFAKSRAFNTVGSMNSAGILAAIILPLFLKTKLCLRGIPFIDFAKIGLLAALVILAIMNWWVLWLVAGAGMLAVISLDSVAGAVSRGSLKRWSMVRFLVPMMIIVLAVFLMIVKFNFSAVKSNLPVEVAPSARLSLSIVKNVLNTSLVTGYGPENFYLAFDKFGASALANSTFLNYRFFDSMSGAFNRVVQEGIIGLLAILGLGYALVYSLMKFRSVLAEHIGTEHVIGVYAASIAAIAAFLFYPMNLTLLFVLYILLAMLALLLPSRGERSVSIEGKPIFSLSASLGFVAGLIIILTGWYFLGSAYVADIVFAKAAKDTDTKHAIDHMVFASNLNKSNDSYYRALSQSTLMLLTNELNSGNRNDADRTTRIQNYTQSAVDLARRATEVAPLETDNWFNLGTVYQALFGLVENVDGLAEEAYLKAASLRPGDPTYQNKIGTMFLAKADFLRQLARSAGQDGNSLNQQSDAALLKAEASFKKAIELSNNFGIAIYNLSAVYDRQGKVNEAIRQIEKIVPFNANQPNLMFELGLLYYRVDRKDDALKALQRAVMLAPDFANARWYIALIYEERRDLPSAIEQLQKILETNKDNQTVLDKLAKLQQGKRSIPPEKVIDQKPLQ